MGKQRPKITMSGSGLSPEIRKSCSACSGFINWLVVASKNDPTLFFWVHPNMWQSFSNKRAHLLTILWYRYIEVLPLAQESPPWRERQFWPLGSAAFPPWDWFTSCWKSVFLFVGHVPVVELMSYETEYGWKLNKRIVTVSTWTCSSVS